MSIVFPLIVSPSAYFNNFPLPNEGGLEYAAYAGMFCPAIAEDNRIIAIRDVNFMNFLCMSVVTALP
ncbi:hypothetical protein NSIN_20327 [Nitrosotalea sinensis]|uniref:Uncharacterized protein n=1 Tax=Nitrosotalea sinensis TaxID=1499975 RepID=A0A2H1EGA7_9ARCH|nr:hypothetical protein NSIN_20327 [Candidatus Nitrosotalea sinensis]